MKELYCCIVGQIEHDNFPSSYESGNKLELQFNYSAAKNLREAVLLLPPPSVFIARRGGGGAGGHHPKIMLLHDDTKNGCVAD